MLPLHCFTGLGLYDPVTLLLTISTLVGCLGLFQVFYETCLVVRSGEGQEQTGRSRSALPYLDWKSLTVCQRKQKWRSKNLCFGVL